MKKNEMINAWKNAKNKEEFIGAPEVNKEIIHGGAAKEARDSSGWICSFSAECFFGISCNPFDHLPIK